MCPLNGEVRSLIYEFSAGAYIARLNILEWDHTNEKKEVISSLAGGNRRINTLLGELLLRTVPVTRNHHYRGRGGGVKKTNKEVNIYNWVEPSTQNLFGEGGVEGRPKKGRTF